MPASADDDRPLPDRILDAAETVLRRHGADKTNVVDVAKVMGMSHGNVYRVFPNKKAMLDAVAVRWMEATVRPLDAITADRGRSAVERLSAWFDTLRAIKRRKVRDDPELFRAYHKHVVGLRDAVDAHVEHLIGQLTTIVADGVAGGEFSAVLDPAAAARAFLQATYRFHHPALLVLDPPPTDEDARMVLALLVAGMRAGV